MADRRFASLLATLGFSAATGAALAAKEEGGDPVVLNAEQFDTALAAAADQGAAEQRAAGAKEERERTAAVLNSDGGKAHQATALHMLANTDQTAEQINATLATIPVGAAAASEAPKQGAETDAAKAIEGATPKPDLGNGKKAEGGSKDAKGIDPEIAAMQDRVFETTANENARYGAVAR